MTDGKALGMLSAGRDEGGLQKGRKALVGSKQ